MGSFRSEAIQSEKADLWIVTGIDGNLTLNLAVQSVFLHELLEISTELTRNCSRLIIANHKNANTSGVTTQRGDPGSLSGTYQIATPAFVRLRRTRDDSEYEGSESKNPGQDRGFSPRRVWESGIEGVAASTMGLGIRVTYPESHMLVIF